MNNKKISCNILFNNSPGNTHISQILAGYKMLEDRGVLKIKSVSPCTTFRSSGYYEHNSIVEVEINGKILVYDMADGYQSIHRKDVFDAQLDRVDFYFKRSFLSSFHDGSINAGKIKPLSLNYLCTCKNNPYDRFYIEKENGISEIRRFATHLHTYKNDKYFFEQFESNNKRYDEYKLLFLARIWDSSKINAESIKRTYPYFTDAEAKNEADKWKFSLDNATRSRIEYIKSLRNHFGDRVISGISHDDFSEKTCPDLLVDNSVSERNNYIQMIKKNYVCITSEGLHHSIGWKFAEYVAAGKAIITEPLFYEVPYGFEENENYLVYNDTESLIGKCDYLLNNISEIHRMEDNNRKYYSEHVRPDMLVMDSLKTAGIL
ncbi:MAG: glycosyltransferase [Clostridia bacterium]|nr:glycosyltransferase [Clostridia bacterium]